MRPVPIQYPVTLGYRQKASFDPNYIHRGIDYGCPSGTPVVASRGGVVVYAGNGGGYGPAYGIQVVVQVGNIWCLYAHLSSEQVSVGQSVSTGQQLGRSGATGNVRGAHLHYQENTKAPAAYTSDRAPQFVTSTITDTIFDAAWWSQAAARFFGKPWLPRVPGIGKTIRGVASVYGFSELYTNSDAQDVLNQLNSSLNVDGTNFKRAHRDPTLANGGPAGLEVMYNADHWRLERPPVAYSSGIQNRWAFVVHLTRIQTGQHVAFVAFHGPVFYTSLKEAYGKWLGRLLTQIDKPVVLFGDTNRISNANSPRKEIQAAGFRTIEQQVSQVNESADEFPGEGDLADGWTDPDNAPIISGKLWLTDLGLSDHRMQAFRVRVKG